MEIIKSGKKIKKFKTILKFLFLRIQQIKSLYEIKYKK